MEAFLTRSLDPNISDRELETQGVQTTSFLSFERAIDETNLLAGIKKNVKGYRVTPQGIVIIWEN